MDAERSHFSILIFSKALEKEARERLLKEIEEARKRVKSVQYCIKTSDIYIWFFEYLSIRSLLSGCNLRIAAWQNNANVSIYEELYLL